MKEIEVSTEVPDCDAKAYFAAIYSDDKATRAFHAEVNGDATATAQPWGADGTRTVTFVMPMNVPAFLKRIIGLDSVPVTEVQKLEWAADRSSFKLVSEPTLNFPGANKFTTSGFLEVSTKPNGTTLVTALMRCSAGLAWPLNTQVEATMATEAQASISTFLEWCKNYFKKWRAEQEEVPERPAPPPAGARAASTPSAAAGGGPDVFYDAWDDETELTRQPTGAEVEGGEAAGTSGSSSTEVVPYTPKRLEDVIVECLRHIQASTSDTAASLRSLEDMIRNMDDNIQVLRDKLAGKRPAAVRSRPPAAAAAAAKAATTAATAAAAPAAGWGGYLGALAAVSLVAGTGAVAYMRYKQVSAGSGGGK
ncbi:hypothetical protein HYH02_014916 [Chlamydomonas schloesseri]|uniref:VASt domain-containing protein n=1 Tax=Chlamydomonas schloesseri TaxID=2026947 RepID=A0A835SER9_9CHLO|nr:hypothetical protein HYH02_014916 [Chlamydomonas schloesseri]|eukprot:KAG2425917.1 hypothetical protein HYH02_014916 [Chlamydomonas schloesseri]